jgi:glycosyltransferase involved in cell wall biosynthesis
MLFSVLIANYNNSAFLATALNSVLCQRYPGWEIILVDDGSTDEFEKVILPFTNDTRIKIYRNEENFGCGYTKRKCGEYASGSLLGFLDPDDSLHPEALAIMARAHMESPECSLIHSTHYICDEELNVIRIADYPRPLPAGIPYLLVSDGRIHHFATFKKYLYDRTKGISPLNKKAVDQDLYYKLEEVGEVLYIATPLYYYRIHPGAISNAGQEKKAMMANYSIVMEACIRRIRHLKSLPQTGSADWIRKYRICYYKIKIFNSFRKKEYLRFLASLFIYPFVGGLGNMIRYSKKLPKEGFQLIRKSLIDSYEIKSK